MQEELQNPLGPRFSEALVFAAEIHRRQPRKGGTQIPYIAHLLGVASIALEYGADEDEGIAALLHDAIEDAPRSFGPGKAHTVRQWLQFKFGSRVLEIVEGCTDADTEPKPPWRARKERYISRIAHEPASVILVSASDKLHNARAVLADYRTVGVGVFERFNTDAGVEGTIGYYRGLVTAFQQRRTELDDVRLPGLITELDRAVKVLEHETGVVGTWPRSGAPESAMNSDGPLIRP